MAAKNIYEEELRKWQQQFQNTAAAKPADYQSQYTPQMQSAMSQYQNQKPFEYDVNADALYQQMKDSYTRSGKMAMQDTMGKAAAMTGGYGNTYAQVAGQQQYGQYMQGLNDNIPALQDRAYQRYQDEGGKLLNQFNLAGQMEGLDYQKYQDALGNWQNQQGFDYGAMQDAQAQTNWKDQFDYGQQRDTVADTQWQSQFDYGKSQDQQSQENWQQQFQYGQAQDEQSQQNWQEQFGYGQSQDALEYQKWAQQFQYGQSQDQLAQQNWQEQFGYGKTQDQLSQENWQKQFQYGQAQDNQSQANWDEQFNYGVQSDQKDQAFSLAMTALQAGKLPPADLLTQAGIDSQTANLMQSIFTKPVTVSKSGSSKSSGKTTITIDQQNDADTLFKAGGANALEAYCTKLENAGIASSAVLNLYNDVIKYNAKDTDYYQQSADPFGEKGL